MIRGSFGRDRSFILIFNACIFPELWQNPPTIDCQQTDWKQDLNYFQPLSTGDINSNNKKIMNEDFSNSLPGRRFSA